jgi:hypothetical protein
MLCNQATPVSASYSPLAICRMNHAKGAFLFLVFSKLLEQSYRTLKTDPVSTDKKTNAMPSTSHLAHPAPGMDLARPPKIPIAPR